MTNGSNACEIKIDICITFHIILVLLLAND